MIAGWWILDNRSTKWPAHDGRCILFKFSCWIKATHEKHKKHILRNRNFHGSSLHSISSVTRTRVDRWSSSSNIMNPSGEHHIIWLWSPYLQETRVSHCNPISCRAAGTLCAKNPVTCFHHKIPWLQFASNADAVHFTCYRKWFTPLSCCKDRDKVPNSHFVQKEREEQGCVN